jgi:hypothetical protein
VGASSFLALARALTRAAGPPALLRVAPPLLTVGLVSSVIFGGYGMRPRDLVAVLATSRAARASLWAAWILLTAPAARALLATPTTFVLRALPAPLPWFWLVHGAHLLALQAPWMLLFAAGAGPLASLAAGLGAAAAGALVVARPRALPETAAAIALAATLLLGAPPAVLLAVALVTGTVGVEAAFRRAPERAAPEGRSWIAGSAPFALALAHAAVLARRDAVTLARGSAAALVGALVAGLAARNNAVMARADQEQIALAAGGIPLALATSGVAVRVLATERRLDWLLLSTATSVRLRALLAAAVTAAWGTVAGVVYGSVAAIAVANGAAGRLRIALLGAALGASLGGVAAHLARRAERPTGVDGTVMVSGMAVAGIVATTVAGWLGAAAVWWVAAAGCALAAATVPLLERRERLTEHAARIAWEDG